MRVLSGREPTAGEVQVGDRGLDCVHQCARGGCHTLEELAEFWKVRSDCARPIEQAVTWADVTSNILVKKVAARAPPSVRMIYEAGAAFSLAGTALRLSPLEGGAFLLGPFGMVALMLMECDSGAQRTFFCTFGFDRRSSKQFGRPLMESDWNKLVGRLIETIPPDGVREIGERVREANTGVKSVL